VSQATVPRVLLPHDEAGSGSPVVLLHAGIADRTMWSDHLGPLAEAGYRAIAIDLPGFGEAPLPAEQAPWRDVLVTLDVLGAKSAMLVGNSFGGAVALRVALTAPKRVAGLALVSAPAPVEEPSPELEAAWEAEEAALEAGDMEAAIEAVVDAWLLPDAPAALRERVADMQRRAFAQQLGADEVPEADDPLEANPDALADLELPALVLTGEHDMPDFHSGAHLLAGQLRTQHVVIPGARHLAPLEEPEAFREHLLGFLTPPEG
jgi:pimeloyl-ACP methyl ester carboxylesterase